MAIPFIQIGIVVGIEYKKNRSSDRTVIMLQVSFSDDDDADVQSVQLFSQAGETYVPPIDSAVIVLAITPSFKIAIASDDGIDPIEIKEGERLLYSSDDTGERKAKIKLDIDGNVTMNEGEDWAVQFSAMKQAFDKLVEDFNGHLHIVTCPTGGACAVATPTTPSTADMSEAKVETVLVP